ncbi:hypothetical protein BBJ28_00006277, partial [Nothophytophthora sp. Chile5]
AYPTAPNAWQKQVGRQKEHANKKLSSWFLAKFSSKKPQLLREHDEETAQALRQRPRPGHISAVTNQQHASAALHREDLSRPKTVRQRSFLRQQLQEMKRQSAETLLIAQKRMDGELVEEDEEDDGEEEGLHADQPRFSDDESDDDVRVINEPDDVLRSSVGSSHAETPTTSRSRSSSVRRKAGSSRRRSVAEEQQDREDTQMAEQVQREEYSMEANRRMSQATQLYAEAISALDYALHPNERQPDMEPAPQPLLLGVKKGSANMPKSEWI